MAILTRWSAFSIHWPPILRHAVTVFFITAISLALIRLGALNTKFRFLTMFRYPPIWISAFLIGFMFTGFILYNSKFQLILLLKEFSLVMLPTFSVACGGVLLAFVYEGFDAIRSSPTKALSRIDTRRTRARSLSSNNDEDLIAWILDESPIKHPTDDVFDHAIPARRIARLLMQETPSSIGVIGPYGCGKSSLLNLIEYYLENTNDLGLCNADPCFSGQIVRCKIDGWGRISGTAAQKIIALAIAEVRRHVDCMSIVALPENYRNAIAGASSTGGAVLSALLQISHEPVAQLSKLDNILAAANMRLIIFLEDLDRNVGDEIIRDEMPALLDRLRVLGQVSFVLAIGTDRQFSDVLIRICDHVEAVS